MINWKISILDTSTEVLNTTEATSQIMLSNDSDTTIYVSLWEAAVVWEWIRLNANWGSVSIDSTNVSIQKIYAISSVAWKSLCYSII